MMKKEYTRSLETIDIPNLDIIASEAYNINKCNGIYDNGLEDKIIRALVTTELCEAINAYKNDRRANIYEFNRQYDYDACVNFEDYIKDSLEDELSDAVIISLASLKYMGLSCVNMFKEKGSERKFSESILAIKDGNVISYIDFIISSMYGCFSTNETYIHSLSLVVLRVLVLAKYLDIDIFSHINMKLDYNKLRYKNSLNS